MKHIVLFLVLLSSSFSQATKSDLVIFSYDRPLQLFALLESVYTYMSNIEEIIIITRTSAVEYTKAYMEVKKVFPNIKLQFQGSNPRSDFKHLVLQSSFESKSDYVIFAVDDDIVKDFVNVSYCIHLLQETKSYGFYLRQGLHLENCYSAQKNQSLPKFTYVTSDVITWVFKDGELDWCYPNMLDMALYRKRDIKQDLFNLSFFSPNSLESYWHMRSSNILNRSGLCFINSKIVNIPINKVQSEINNVHMDLYSSRELLDIFNSCKKIDINPLFRISNKSGHMNYEPKFVDRIPQIDTK